MIACSFVSLIVRKLHIKRLLHAKVSTFPQTNFRIETVVPWFAPFGAKKLCCKVLVRKSGLPNLITFSEPYNLCRTL